MRSWTRAIARIHGAVSVPLVLHGPSGVSDALLAAAVAAGMTKINVATQLNKVFTTAVRECLVPPGPPAAVLGQLHGVQGDASRDLPDEQHLNLPGPGPASDPRGDRTPGRTA